MTDARVILPSADRASILTFVAGQLRRRRLLLAVTVVTQVAARTTALVPALAIGWVTQAVVDRRGLGVLAGPAVVLMAAAAAAALLEWAEGSLFSRTVMPLAAAARDDAVRAAVELPIDVVEAGGSGDLVSRVSGDAEALAQALSESAPLLVGAIFSIVATIVSVSVLDWRLALLILLTAPLHAATGRWYSRRSRVVFENRTRAEGRRTAALLTGISALPTLRALQLEQVQRRKIEVASQEVMRFAFDAARATAGLYARVAATAFLTTAAALVVATVLVAHQFASVASCTSAILLLVGLTGPVSNSLQVVDGAQRGAASLARLVGVRSALTPIDHAPVDENGLSGPLRADRISFGFQSGRDTIDDVSLRVEPGGRLAIVGPTGSGKTTLATLLTGLRRPRSGTIALGDVNLSDLDLPQRRVALIAQDPYVFARSVLDNVRLARPEAGDTDIEQVIDRVGARPWIDALPQQSATLVGPGGHPLSTAEAQHLALARILLLDPEVVVLDEASSESGSDNARALDHAVDVVMHGRTSISIAHRLSQATSADQILVVMAGRVVERGTHDELVTADGTYARLWRAWSR